MNKPLQTFTSPHRVWLIPAHSSSGDDTPGVPESLSGGPMQRDIAHRAGIELELGEYAMAIMPRRPAFASGRLERGVGDASRHFPEFQERYHGHLQALRTHGIVPDDALQVDAESSQHSGRRAVETLLARGASFDDIPMASFVNPPLTTVQQDTHRAGEMLVDSLLRLIHNEPVESRMLPMKLVVRRSSLWQEVTRTEHPG